MQPVLHGFLSALNEIFIFLLLRPPLALVPVATSYAVRSQPFGKVASHALYPLIVSLTSKIGLKAANLMQR